MGLALIFVAALLGAQALELPAPLPPLVLNGLPAATRVELERAYDAAVAAPAVPAAHGQLGMVLHAHAQYTLAAACYTRARELDPTSLQWTYLAGVVSAEAGAHTDAARAFRAALTIDSDYLPARVRLADVLFRLGELQASGAEYRTLLAQHPDLAVAHYGLGRVATLRGDRDAAIEQYLRATQVSPPFGAAHYALALALRAAGRTSEAAAHFAEYRRWGVRRPAPHDPLLDDVRALNGTARELLVQAARLGMAGRLDESIELNLNALAIDPAAAQAHVNLISLFGRKGRVDLAERQRNAGGGRFVDVSAAGGPAFLVPEVSRAAAFGDVDNDGDIDVLVTINGGPARLLLNDGGSERAWLQVRLQGVADTREGLGARVKVRRHDGIDLWRRAHTDGSYLSASDPRVHFGLGSDAQIGEVVVEWRRGPPERWCNLRPNAVVTLKQGTGTKQSGC